jgi:hypothetical protein
MIILALEGSHGCGKTELCSVFANEGFDILDEGFLDLPCGDVHPQSLVMEMEWVSNWFQRVLECNSRDCNQILIADRSPLSAVFYTRDKKGLLLKPLIESMFIDLLELGIEVYTVYIRVEKEILWNRIQQRLLIEPERAMYKEDSKSWMEEVVSFYDNFHGWDFSIDNSTNAKSALVNVMNEVMYRVGSRSPRFGEHHNRSRKKCSSPLILDHVLNSPNCGGQENVFIS